MGEIEEKKEQAETKEEITPQRRVIIRTYPRISVMLYILGLVCLIFGITELILPFTGLYRALGLIFITIYLVLGLTMAYEFTEVRLLLLLALFIAAAILLIALGHYGVLPAINLREIYEKLDLAIGPHAYLGMALTSFLILALIWISARLNYWIIEPNQIIRKAGILRKTEKFTTQGVKFTASITDMFAYLTFFRSGTIILDIPTEKRTIILTLVPNIKSVEEQIKKTLSP
ncbi:MAG: hypothetical protein NDP19_05885 [Crenarchaeota archaeon]|nr:hypothetical protein [Thermoproteota archaeon]